MLHDAGDTERKNNIRRFPSAKKMKNVLRISAFAYGKVLSSPWNFFCKPLQWSVFARLQLRNPAWEQGFSPLYSWSPAQPPFQDISFFPFLFSKKKNLSANGGAPSILILPFSLRLNAKAWKPDWGGKEGLGRGRNTGLTVFQRPLNKLTSKIFLVSSPSNGSGYSFGEVRGEKQVLFGGTSDLCR